MGIRKLVSQRDLFPALCLATYDLWLLSFPLKGYFLPSSEHSFLPYFLLPHTLSFFIIFWAASKEKFSILSGAGAVLTSVLTALYPFLLGKKSWLFVVIGISSAPLLVRIGCVLGKTKDPVKAAAAGLIGGNLLLALLVRLDPPQEGLFPVLGVLLLLCLGVPLPPQRPESLREIWKYLPFISVFYFLLEMSYVSLLPDYMANSYIKGLELPFYIAAVAFSARIFRIRPDYSLATGVCLGMLVAAFPEFDS